MKNNLAWVRVEASINAPIETVWEKWTSPQAIEKWYNASEDWHTPKAENDVRAGGKFMFKMAAKDGSFAFDFEGTYDAVSLYEMLDYTIIDGRKVKITFKKNDANTTELIESFQAEDENSIEIQQIGWQAIVNNFKKYVEAH